MKLGIGNLHILQNVFNKNWKWHEYPPSHPNVLEAQCYLHVQGICILALLRGMPLHIPKHSAKKDKLSSVTNLDWVFHNSLLYHQPLHSTRRLLSLFFYIKPPFSLLRIKLKRGLVCELTLRVNRHSNSQESPLCHHFVF